MSNWKRSGPAVLALVVAFGGCGGYLLLQRSGVGNYQACDDSVEAVKLSMLARRGRGSIDIADPAMMRKSLVVCGGSSTWALAATNDHLDPKVLTTVCLEADPNNSTVTCAHR